MVVVLVLGHDLSIVQGWSSRHQHSPLTGDTALNHQHSYTGVELWVFFIANAEFCFKQYTIILSTVVFIVSTFLCNSPQRCKLKGLTGQLWLIL